MRELETREDLLWMAKVAEQAELFDGLYGI